jgi:hypothetical protein
MPMPWKCVPLLAVLVACGAPGPEAPADEVPAEGVDEGEQGLGEVDDYGIKSDGWGKALECKPIPNVPALARPEIVISLDGLTLHLRDKGGTYDRVFPIGPGAIDAATGKSLTPLSTGTPTGLFYTSGDTREVSDAGWGWYYPCRIWWTDSETKERRPVFAGLPFIRLVGPPTSAYAIHGPVDGFALPSGGNLRRGFVSHGCTRMAAADIVEVYARIRGRAKVPVRVQKEVERDTFGRAYDVPEKWIGQECAVDADCNYAGGTCATNRYGRSFCTKACTGSCPDKPGYATTRCVQDGRGGGMCALTSQATNDACRAYDGLVAKSSPLFGRSGRATVCLPGTSGAFAEPCRGDRECKNGGVCVAGGLAGGPGFCSAPCSSTCEPGSVCTAVGDQKRCVPRCWGQDACALGTSCEDDVPRASGGTARACVP